MSRARRMWTWVVSLAVLYLAVCAAIYFLQERLVFHPGAQSVEDPGVLGLRFETLRIATDDGETLHAWLVATRQARRRGTVLVSHGNAGSLDARLAQTDAFVRAGFDVLLYDYRGYGESSGSPTEEGVYRDARAAYDALRARGEDPRRIVLYGESLGGAISIELARSREVAALVLENAFASLSDMGAALYPWLPARFLARGRFDSLAKIGALKVPVLVLATQDDRVVPYEQAQRLFARANEPKRFLETGGGHNAGGFTQRRAWIEEVGRFLREHTPE